MNSLLCASVLVRPLVDGPQRRLNAVDRTRMAWQLTDDSGRVRCELTTPDANPLPHALIVDELPPADVEPWIGSGGLAWGDGLRRPCRWFIPARPRVHGFVIDDARVDTLAGHWRETLGLGEGLTPYQDDVLCGSLIVLAATGSASRLRAVIAASDLERRTTATSAALIRLACDGWCITAVADHLRRLVAGVDDPSTRARLLAVGHSSGRGLLAGMTSVLGRTSVEVAA